MVEGDLRRSWRDRRLRLAHRRFGGDLKYVPSLEYGTIPLQDISTPQLVSSSSVSDTPNTNLPEQSNTSNTFDTSFLIGKKSPFYRSLVDGVLDRLSPFRSPDTVDTGRQVSRSRLPPSRTFGVGVVGNITNREVISGIQNNNYVREMLENLSDYRPFFTYWLCFVQIIIMVCGLIAYGLGPLNYGLSHSSGLVMSVRLTIEHVDVYTPGNLWIGPKYSDLIKMGATFTPCMKSDPSVDKMIKETIDYERDKTGCCVRNDGSGCVQTSKEHCSPFLSTFYKWSKENPGPEGRISGPVCKQDPRYCVTPSSNGPFIWKDNISKWPLCLNSSNTKLGAPPHMTCKSIAKPCCVGIHGKCEMRTQEYCNWVGGSFHPEANLCSQVSCLNDICSMYPLDTRQPKQFYRLISSLFVTAGLIHLSLTLLFQCIFMADVEKMCGWVRISIIFFLSGIVGNLLSALLTPYRPECGPSGGLFGIFGTLFIEIIKAWKILRHPLRELGKLMMVLAVISFMGFLPWIDSYAHFFGFITGLIVSYIILPQIHTDNKWKKFDKIFIPVLSIVSTLILISLFLIFYLVELQECKICKLFSCIPFTKDFCADHNINFERSKGGLF